MLCFSGSELYSRWVPLNLEILLGKLENYGIMAKV